MRNSSIHQLRAQIAVMLTLLTLISTPLQAMAATITVNTLEDSGTEGDCELRDAISSANSNIAVDGCNPGEDSDADESLVDIIDFSTGAGTIVLNGTELPAITESVMIDGDIDDDMNPDISVDAWENSRILELQTGNVTIDGVKMLNGAAPGQVGGSLHVQTNASLTLTNSTVEHPLNTAVNAAQGGAIGVDLDAGKVLLENVQISDTSANTGGAIYLEGESSTEGEEDIDLEMNNTTITNSTALTGDGGAVSLGNNTEVDFDTVTVTNAKAARHGGAVYHAGETGPAPIDTDNLTLKDFVVAGGEANVDGNGGRGGCLYLGPSVEGVSVKGLNLNTCIADLGGGIYQSLFAKMSIADSAEISNSTAKKGAGIYLDGNARLDMTAGTVTGNNADNFGGGLFLVGNNVLNVKNALFSSNTAGEDGGGMYLQGAYNMQSPAIKIGMSIFENNTAVIDGGGICLGRGSVALNGVEFKTNVAHGSGGAVAMKDNGEDSNMTIESNSIFTDNLAAIGGGDIFMNRANRNIDMQVKSASFNHNEGASGDGGVIYNDNADITMSDVTMVGSGNPLAYRGGAIYNKGDFADMSIINSSMQSFSVDASGGAVYNAGGNLTIENSTIQGNTAAENGGGVYSEANLTIQKSYVGNNIAVNGGGMQIAGGSLSLINSTVGNNQATSGNGGGLLLSAASEGNQILASTIAFNTAGSAGGGMLLSTGSSVNISSTIVASNQAQTAGADCDNQGSFSGIGFNLFGDSNGCGEEFHNTDLRDVSAGLGTLDLHGGPTLNFALLANSPAINKGFSQLKTDQRGVTRPQGEKEDIGAYERQNKGGAILTEVKPVESPTPDYTPDYTFSSTEEGAITYGGGCSSDTVTATVGNVTVTFNTLTPGEYALCTITITDVLGNISEALAISSFTIIEAVPTEEEVVDEIASEKVVSKNTTELDEDKPLPVRVKPVASGSSTEEEVVTGESVTAELGEVVAAEDAQILAEGPVNLLEIPALVQAPSTDQRPDLYQYFALPTTTTEGGASSAKTSCDSGTFAAKYGLTNVQLSGDSDGDGLSDGMECQLATNPLTADTDSDGHSDSMEILNFFTNPTQANVFNTAVSDEQKSFVMITSPGVKLATGDDSPIFQGQTAPRGMVGMYLFDAAVFENLRTAIRQAVDTQENLTATEKDNLFEEKFSNEVALVLRKSIDKSLNPDKANESQFIGKAKLIGQTEADQNGTFVLDSEVSLRDNKYLAMAVTRNHFSKAVEFTLNSALALLTPKVQTIGSKPLDAAALNGEVTLDMPSGITRPVLTGQVTTPSRVVALWKSNVTGSALLADSLDQDFRLTPPSDLEPGEHSVYLTAYRNSDNAQSKTQKITFRIHPGAAAVSAGLPMMPIALGAVIMVLVLGVALYLSRRRRHGGAATAAMGVNFTAPAAGGNTTAVSTPNMSADINSARPSATESTQNPGDSGGGDKTVV